MGNSFRLLKIKGISIEAHWSWVLVLGLVVFSLASALFPSTYPGLAVETYWWMGVTAAVLFFTSIVLHELGHSLRALREGMHIDGVTLWLLGGVARFSGMFPSAGAEFRIAIAGPIVSVVLVVAFLVLRVLFGMIGMPSPVVGVLDYLARINAIVVAFNLIPALPLDGGRVLRAFLWHRQRDFSAATASASRAGVAFGGLLGFVGVVNLLVGQDTSGLWLVILGWFLIRAAEAEAQIGLLRRVLSGRSVADVMTRRPDTVAPTLTIQQFLDYIVRPRGHAMYPVFENGHTYGIVNVSDAAAVREAERSDRRVSDVMLSLDEVPVLRPDDDALDALEQIRESPRQRAIVHDNGDLVGVLSMSDIARAAALEHALSRSSRAQRTGFAVWIPVAAIMLLAAAALYHPPLVVVEPGATADVSDDITITGANTDENRGQYLLTSIRLARPTALGALWSAVALDRDVLPLDAVIPPGGDTDTYFENQRQVFRESRMLAAAAAARAAGMNVTVSGTGAVVKDIVDGSPADQSLTVGDVIVAIDGRRVRMATDVQQVVRELTAGTRVEMTIERGSTTTDVAVRTAPLPQVPEVDAGLGIAIETRDLVIDLPFEITFEERSVGGPSAGLVYALAIADMLHDRDYATGAVGASGTIDPSGSVGPVGGLEAKAEALQSAGAEVFIVHQQQVDEVDPPEGLEVRGVERLEQALKALQSS